jgi:putative AdoMet-dependent methyltransferase
MWQYDEFLSVGRDYRSPAELAAYDGTHASFRDVAAESRHVLQDLLQVREGGTAAGGTGRQTLIDYGCGTGTLCLEAARLYPDLVVHGVDVSAAMLLAAREKSGRWGIANEKDLSGRLHFHNAGFLTYDHGREGGGSGSGGTEADYVTTTFALHHLPDLWKGVALRRINGAMRTGGRLHVRDVIVRPDHPLDDIEAFVRGQAASGAAVRDGGFLKADAEGHFREEFSTYDWVMEGLLERAGFAIERKEVEENSVIVSYVCRKL